MTETTDAGTDQEATSIDALAINTIRTLAMDAVQKANSGHPGTPMALAPLAYVLYTQVMRHNPANPHWPNRDRFVLSRRARLDAALRLLHLSGYDLTLDDIKQFRQWRAGPRATPSTAHAGRRDDDRPARPGRRQRGRVSRSPRLTSRRSSIGPAHAGRRPSHVLHRAATAT